MNGIGPIPVIRAPAIIRYVKASPVSEYNVVSATANYKVVAFITEKSVSGITAVNEIITPAALGQITGYVQADGCFSPGNDLFHGVDLTVTIGVSCSTKYPVGTAAAHQSVHARAAFQNSVVVREGLDEIVARFANQPVDATASAPIDNDVVAATADNLVICCRAEVVQRHIPMISMFRVYGIQIDGVVCRRSAGIIDQVDTKISGLEIVRKCNVVTVCQGKRIARQCDLSIF
ncbi:MAG: hypothetical protein BWY95_00755 [Bacteroidetes bacterium ADurb.BinA104]|nr:MAG: hypothetical protein BWY95_00755 [Bacteroidetes bacterium ADurb.BinA104]